MAEPAPGVPPPLAPPRLGDPLTSIDGGVYGYVARASAYRQAAMWNSVLANDPFIGPSTGLIVGVSPIRVESRYQLVWVPVGYGR